MERACFLLQVKPERVEEYRRTHEVWPEMREAMREVGLRNYSMYLRPDGLVVGYLEGEHIQQSLRQLAQTEVNARWQAQMAPFFTGESGDMHSEGLEWLEEYFYLP